MKEFYKVEVYEGTILRKGYYCESLHEVCCEFNSEVEDAKHAILNDKKRMRYNCEWLDDEQRVRSATVGYLDEADEFVPVWYIMYITTVKQEIRPAEEKYEYCY